MFVNTLLAAAATLLVSTSAAPAPAAGVPHNYDWQVTGFSAGCARTDCYYNFNVTGPQHGNIPGFLAYCSGYDVGYFAPCQVLSSESRDGVVPQVAAVLKTEDRNYPDGIAAMGVSLKFTDGHVTSNYTGHHNATFNQFVAPLENFEVKPSQVTRVA